MSNRYLAYLGSDKWRSGGDHIVTTHNQRGNSLGDEITIAELLEASREEKTECLQLARQALRHKEELSYKALKDRSDKHGDLHHEIKPLVDAIGSFETVTVKALLDAIERDHLACLELEKKAFQKKQAIAENAFRRQGNHYELLYQDIMYFVNKICPEAKK